MTVSEQIADELYGLHCDIGRLEVENRKLRKLVHDMGFLIAWADWNTDKDDEKAYQLVCRAEGLGIEVNR